ncbi:MAG: thioredoxin domain-containing protein, partial [Acidilobaceae archaeon]
MRPNRLVGSRSPYLLQHACNPVDWRPWGSGVFEEARVSGRPLFISIGYSTCHWCHVMARESFEDAEVAMVLNEYFIPVKVDREEMPDVDSFYMAYCLSVSASCGWPLNVIAAPDGRPFYVRTYMSKRELLWVLLQVAKAWNGGERGEVERVASEAMEALRLMWAPGAGILDFEEAFKSAYASLSSEYDPVYGGFGSGPKFPVPHNISFLFRYWYRFGDGDAVEMALRTLDYMISGGIHDIVGGGFHRYAVDRKWLLPHFEKMLYDQALILAALLEAYAITGDVTYRWASGKIVDFALRELQSPEGGFYSAVSSESGGVEGGFYTWSVGELREALEDEEFKTSHRLFNVSDRGNYVEEATGRTTGRNILYIGLPLREASRIYGLSLEELLEFIDRVSTKLSRLRGSRPKPEIDDKILGDWNGLMISSLARAYQVLGYSGALEAAVKAAEFIESNMVEGD